MLFLLGMGSRASLDSLDIKPPPGIQPLPLQQQHQASSQQSNPTTPSSQGIPSKFYASKLKSPCGSLFFKKT